jgi:Ca-activated chloride channel family protein
MSFANIEYSIYIISVAFAICVFFIFYMWFRRYSVKALFPDSIRKALLRGNSSGRVLVKEILLIIAIILCTVMVLRPQWGEQVREEHNDGTDLLIALDVSRSMLTQDVQPSRLQRSKDAVRLLVESLGGDRVGMVLFAGSAFLQCPLTNDKGAFMMFLEGASPASIALQGTNIAAALDEAQKFFNKKRLTSKVLLLITDGEDHEGRVRDAADKLKELGVTIYTAGVGQTEGALVPVAHGDNSADIYMRDFNGKLVRSKKNIALLKNIASSTGGKYIDLTSNLSGIYRIINVLERQQKNDFGSRMVREPKEQYQIFAALLFFILGLELFIASRRKRV